MSKSFLAGQSSLWVLPDGPNTEPKYLGCHGVGDVARPKGDVTSLYCPDPSAPGKFTVKGRYRGEPGAVTTTITTDLRATADYLEDLGDCLAAIYIHKVTCGRRDVFSNFDRSFVLRNALVTNQNLTALAARAPTDEGESGQAFDVSADELLSSFNLEAIRYAVVDTEDITGITICGEARCAGDCGKTQKISDYLFASTKPLVGSVGIAADVLASIEGGAWAATAADPFAINEDIQGIVCFMLSRDTLRIMAARGTTDGANPAEIAYSDDHGVTWTTVNVGAVNGEYVSNGHAFLALDRYHIWLGTDGGRIYFSSDAGLTWTIQENAAISPTAVVGISFVDPDVGYTVYIGGLVAKTSNGSHTSATWTATAVTGLTAALDIYAISAYSAFAVGTEGKFYTMDGGVTWTQRDAVPTGAIDFLNELIGMAVGSAASGNIYYTMDGGYSWTSLPAITNSGFTDVKIVSTKLAYVAGNSNGGTSFIARVQPVA